MAGHDQAMITEDLRRALRWVDAMSQRRRGMAGHDQAMITEDLRRAPTVGRCHIPTEEGHGGS